MNPHVNAIAGRLSLRAPQRRSLEIMDRITEIVPPRKGADIQAAIETIKSEYPTVTDFEREFPSLCFAGLPCRPERLCHQRMDGWQ
jgi:type III restriction enzyme